MKNDFFMEIKEVKAVKSVSNDLVYSIKLVCEDSKLLDWGKIPADQLVKVTIESENGRS